MTGGGDPGATTLSCVTWNVHRGRGRDGRVDPRRSAAVLLAEVLDAGTDIAVLTEADEEIPPHAGLLDIGRISRETGLHHAQAAADLRWGADSHGFLGVMVLLGPRIRVEDAALLDLPGHCHRGAVVIDATGAGRRFRLVATHLSLGQPLRIAQMRVIGQHLYRRAPRPVILAGDLNEWRPWGGTALWRPVTGLRLAGPAPATFPAAWPILPLDRILVTPPGRVAAARVLDGPGIRAASDHRPLAARIDLGENGAARP